MRYKITYQDNRSLKKKIIQSSDIQQLKTHKEYPKNVISIQPLEKNFNFKFRQNKKEIYDMFKQLSTMLNANLTLNSSIDLMLKSKQSRTITQILHIIYNSSKSAQPIEQTLKPYEKDIGSTSILFLKLGLQNGNIKETLNSIVQMNEQEYKTKNKLSNSLRYPLVLIISLIVSITMIFVYVIPNFEFILSLLGDNIPYSTKMLLAVQKLFSQYYHFIFISFTTVFITIIYINKKYRDFYDKIIITNIPILSNLIKNYTLYRIFLAISIMVKSKYKFQTALEHTADIANNLFIKQTMQNIIHSVKNGSTIAYAFEQSRLFDDLTVKLLYTAEHSGNHELILNDITTLYKQRFNDSVKNFSSVIEPLTVSIIALIILWVILAVMVPVWDMGSVL